jgi:hypothetical protein
LDPRHETLHPGGTVQEFHTLLREWESFYLLVGTAGATLAGLMFVAISFGERVTDRRRFPILRAHMDPALLAFVLSLGLAAGLMMPSLSRFWFGAMLLGAGLLSLVYIGLVLRQLIMQVGVGDTWDFSDWLWYAAAPVVSGALLLVSGGLGLSAQSHAALTTVGVTLVLLLMMGIRNAWDLVTFAIARLPEDAQPTDPAGEAEVPSGEQRG